MGDNNMDTEAAIKSCCLQPVIPTFPPWHLKVCLSVYHLQLFFAGGVGDCKLHFFLAADFVTFPCTSTFSTDLMTPTATVCFMSRTAKRPRGA